ncbi:MAG: hypothetical protein WCI18_06035 [Pseudomonadota bacterium]
MKTSKLFLAVLSGLVMGACQNRNNDVLGHPHQMTDASMGLSAKTDDTLALNGADLSKSHSCKSLNIPNLPFWFPETKVFLTRVSAACSSGNGNLEAQEGAQWVAMGIPCSGGDHRFRWLENYDDPKQVLFDFAIACPMAHSQAEVSESISKTTGLDASKLIAFNPMSVVYWELQNTGEKDVGSLIRVTNIKELKPYWREFLYKKKPLTFKLVGFESAWLEGRKYFEVQVDVFLRSRNRFSIEIKNTKVLESKDVANLQFACKELTPRRDCDRVF